jgi:hypothetical protein
MLDELVELVHVDVREELRGEVPYGNAPCAAAAVSLSLSDWRGVVDPFL